MKMHHLPALLLVAGVGTATSLASSAPLGLTTVTQWQDYNNVATGYRCVGSACEYFSARTYVDFNGVPVGEVLASYQNADTQTYTNISCGGPEYANVLTVNMGNGASTLNARLDPSSPSCSTYDIAAPLTLNLVGQANGQFSASNRGTGQEERGGMTFKYNIEGNAFGVTFNGTGAFLSGPFEGGVNASRQTSRMRTR